MGWGAGASQALPEVVNCFPHSRHLRGPSAMWIFRWAFRFPTCTQTGGQKASSPPPKTLVLALPGGPAGVPPFLRSRGEGKRPPDLPSQFLPQPPLRRTPRPQPG